MYHIKIKTMCRHIHISYKLYLSSTLPYLCFPNLKTTNNNNKKKNNNNKKKKQQQQQHQQQQQQRIWSRFFVSHFNKTPSSPDATPWPVTNKPEVSDVTCSGDPKDTEGKKHRFGVLKNPGEKTHQAIGFD